MPSYNTHVLPTTQGLTLGTPNQEWASWLSSINGSQPVTIASAMVPWSASAAFVATTVISVFTTTLLGNTGISFSGVPGLVVFQITQDSIGGRSFVWPANLLQGSPVGQIANQVTTQLFYYDGTNGWPLGPGVLNP